MSNRVLSKIDAPKNLLDSEKELHENDFIVSKTDTVGKIIYCNEICSNMAGYPASSLIGSNHNILRHPDMPQIAFKIAWDLIKSSKEFFGFVKNLCADGSFYWVFAYMTADLNNDGKVVSYTSVRRKAPKSAIEKIIPIYKLLLDAETRGGMDASLKVLNDYLSSIKMSYQEFVINLQKGATI
jgi:PAS domain S-box-containing protein